MSRNVHTCMLCAPATPPPTACQTCKLNQAIRLVKRLSSNYVSCRIIKTHRNVCHGRDQRLRFSECTVKVAVQVDGSCSGSFLCLVRGAQQANAKSHHLHSRWPLTLMQSGCGQLNRGRILPERESKECA